jgi:hypothetical protein
MTITQEMLKELFDYREDGNLVRKNACGGNGNYAGRVVGSKPKEITRSRRYVTTKIKGQHYCVHKLIYLWHTGKWPEQLDHINIDTIDNRIENLREATTAQNASNRKLFSSNTSGVKGVSWHKASNKWFVYVDENKKRKNIGYFNDLDFAELVAVEARNKYHGIYANHF